MANALPHRHIKTTLESAARTGLVARGVVYLLIGGLAIWGVTLGGGDSETGPSEAFRALETAPLGRVLIAAIAIGLVMYSAWRMVQAFGDADNKGSDAKARLARLGMAASGVSYFTIALAAGSVLFGSNDSGGDGGATRAMAHWLLDQWFGAPVLVLAGLAMGGVGAAQIWRAVKRQYEDELRDCDVVAWAGPACMLGIGGRGLLFILIGWFLIYAAEDADPNEAMGAAELMGWLRVQPFGLALYLAAATALLGYAVYSFIQARYRRIGADI